jgi:hypothetical protein
MNNLNQVKNSGNYKTLFLKPKYIILTPMDNNLKHPCM